MRVCVLLYIEDTERKSDGKVDLFLDDGAAYSAMKTAYTRTLRKLRLKKDGNSGEHYYKCKQSFAIIADGENVYSWSIGQWKFAKAEDYLAARDVLDTVKVYPNRQ